jgi:hypothetical protein
VSAKCPRTVLLFGGASAGAIIVLGFAALFGTNIAWERAATVCGDRHPDGFSFGWSWSEFAYVCRADSGQVTTIGVQEAIPTSAYALAGILILITGVATLLACLARATAASRARASQSGAGR